MRLKCFLAWVIEVHVAVKSNTGDGAGILTNIPHEFFFQEIQSLFGVSVEAGRYGVGNIFLPQDYKQRQKCISIVEKVINK